MTTENNFAAQAGDEPMRAVVALAWKWHDKAVSDGFAASEPAQELFALLGWPDRFAQVSPRATAEVERVKLPHGHRDDFYLMANARGLAMNSIHTVRSMPNWVLAVKLFATGSTSAHEICNRAGIDPDGYRVKRATTKPGA